MFTVSTHRCNALFQILHDLILPSCFPPRSLWEWTGGQTCIWALTTTAFPGFILCITSPNTGVTMLGTQGRPRLAGTFQPAPRVADTPSNRLHSQRSRHPED